ncbi:hypothetical protein E2562_008551 [Oryza meyeriana var. granulata]|uniref:Uncharacterized protein n=1 Tax=Oryza meyeriana var. granulata TaxID=110450 RepID=A0A6G1C5A3_9ORYZ|nr:hypothetical protein E2562_008551 [Oryza meyeriana var. granulata]
MLRWARGWLTPKDNVPCRPHDDVGENYCAPVNSRVHIRGPDIRAHRVAWRDHVFLLGSPGPDHALAAQDRPKPGAIAGGLGHYDLFRLRFGDDLNVGGGGLSVAHVKGRRAEGPAVIAPAPVVALSGTIVVAVAPWSGTLATS